MDQKVRLPRPGMSESGFAMEATSGDTAGRSLFASAADLYISNKEKGGGL